MDGLVEEGRILLGGPIEDRDQRVVALIAMEAPDSSAVHETLAADPWAHSGILEINDVRTWSIWLRPEQVASS